MIKRYCFLGIILLVSLLVNAQSREVVYSKGVYYSTACLPVDNIHNVRYTRDSILIIVPRTQKVVTPHDDASAQLIAWKNGRPVYAIPVVAYDSVTHRRNVGGDSLRIIFSETSEPLPQYEKQPIVWQQRQVTITDSTQLISSSLYQSIAHGDTALFVVEPTLIHTDVRYIRHITDTIYVKHK